jgi:uncharacterized protein (TIGR03437 family)
VSYGTFFGGSAITEATALTADSQGNAYITGWTPQATDLPVTAGAYCATADCTGAFVAKISPAGTLIWSTYLGDGQPASIAVGPDGSVYVAGSATGPYFPVTPGALQVPAEAGGGFVAKLDPTGAKLLYSSYLGGNAATLALGAQGTLVVAGATTSANLPTMSALQPQFTGGNCGSSYGSAPCTHGFFAGWRSSDMTPLFVSYLGGTGNDFVRGSAVDSAGNVYLTGKTNSTDFPQRNAFQTKVYASQCGPDFGTDYPATCSDAFVAEISPDGKTLLYGTRLGGTGGDSGNALALDPAGDMIVAGTSAAPDFPLANTAESYPGAGYCLAETLDGGQTGCAHAFVTKLSADGSALLYSTFVSGKSADGVSSAVLDAAGDVDIGGATLSTGFPFTNGALRHCNSSYGLGGMVESGDADGLLGQLGNTGFVAELNPQGALLFSTYFGGSAFDEVTGVALDGAGGLYLLDSTASADLPVTAGAIQAQTLSYSNPALGVVGISGSGYLARLTFSTQTSLAPQVDAGCVVNGASFQSGSVAPGEIVSLFGSGLGPVAGAMGVLDSQGRIATQLAGASVTFDGAPAPLLYVGANQINAIVPFSVAGKTSTQIVATVNNVPATPRQQTVAAAAPGIFTADMSGTGQAVVLNQDGSVNSATNPAARGSILTMWLTGLGLMNASYADGEIVSSPMGSLTLPIALNLLTPGSFPLSVLYAGQAPSMAAGVVQVNAQIPTNIQPWLSQVGFFLRVQGGFANVYTYIWLQYIGSN